MEFIEYSGISCSHPKLLVALNNALVDFIGFAFGFGKFLLVAGIVLGILLFVVIISSYSDHRGGFFHSLSLMVVDFRKFVKGGIDE